VLSSIPELRDEDTKDWDVRLSEWVDAFRQALLEAPELHIFISLAAKSPSILGILDKIQSISNILQSQGMNECKSVHHAQGIVWTVMSFTYFESLANIPLIVEGIRKAEQKKDHSNILQHIAADNYDELWAETVRRNIDGIAMQLQKNTNHEYYN